MERTVKIRQCDLCGEEVKEFVSTSEGCSITIDRLLIDIWYGGVRKVDMCQSCSNKLINLIENSFPRMTKWGQLGKIQ